MDFSSYLAFVALSFFYISSPGPAVIFFGFGLADQPLPTVMKSLIGNTLGLSTHAFLGAIGLGAIIVRNPHVEGAATFVSASFLIYLAIKIWRASDIDMHTTSETEHPSGLRSGFLLAITNPKPLLFFSFVLPSAMKDGATWSGITALSLTFLCMSFCILLGYNKLGRKIVDRFLNPIYIRIFNRLAAGMFFAFAGFLLFGYFRA